MADQEQPPKVDGSVGESSGVDDKQKLLEQPAPETTPPPNNTTTGTSGGAPSPDSAVAPRPTNNATKGAGWTDDGRSGAPLPKEGLTTDEPEMVSKTVFEAMGDVKLPPNIASEEVRYSSESRSDEISNRF